ncbi:MAG: hypothetical protein KGS44_05580 [Alphaproteobacteria bacterium]|nr:hypothetical protein [Alphaproteobacteria bacterium]
MMRVLTALSFLAILGAGACVTATPYQPASTADGYGYVEANIESDRVRIVFRGNTVTDREQVEDYLLYRAAELALLRGARHFILTQRDTESDTRMVDFGIGGSRFSHFYYHPLHGWAPFRDPFWDDRSWREITRYEASAEVFFGFGPKPEGDPNAYDAAEVEQTLRARIAPPES